MWDWFLWLVGWSYLTPQGIRLGSAAFLALCSLAPIKGNIGAIEFLFHTIMLAAVGILVAQAASLGAAG